jgi:hypothetical protein
MGRLESLKGLLPDTLWVIWQQEFNELVPSWYIPHYCRSGNVCSFLDVNSRACSLPGLSFLTPDKMRQVKYFACGLC